MGLWLVLRGTQTRELGFQDTTGFHSWLNEIRDWVQLHGPDNWFFGGVLGTIGDVFNAIFEFLQKLISIPASPRPVPEIGWLGVVAIAAWVTWAVAGIRSTILVTASMLFFGIFGLWSESMDLLLVTILSVIVCFVLGLPTGILMARNKTVSTVITPVLDIMQTMPPFAYLAPIALGFGIGPTTGIVLTVIYAFPPLVRITEHGIRSVPATTIEAARSMGLTNRQMLRQVQLPMARAHDRGRHQPEHDGRALDGDHRRPGQRTRPRQARRRRPAGAEHRCGLGGRHRDRADGDHARPDHHGGQRALDAPGPHAAWPR